jgi:hypothetical protein
VNVRIGIRCPVAGSWGHGIEITRSIKCRWFLDPLSHRQLMTYNYDTLIQSGVDILTCTGTAHSVYSLARHVWPVLTPHLSLEIMASANPTHVGTKPSSSWHLLIRHT